MSSKQKTIFLLLGLPFFITFIERYLIKPLVSMFSLPDTSIYLLKVGSISLVLFAICSFLGNTYGLDITKKLKKALTIMFITLLTMCYVFLFSLKVRGFFDNLAVIHLINWVISVFREEFILRGIIQTKASSILKGRFLKIPNFIWLSTIAFSLWHLVNLTIWPWQTVLLQMIGVIPAGIVLGLIREKTGNALLTYLLHICGDLLFFSLYLLLFGKLFFTLF